MIRETSTTTVAESTTIRTTKPKKNVITTRNVPLKLSGVIFKPLTYS